MSVGSFYLFIYLLKTTCRFWLYAFSERLSEWTKMRNKCLYNFFLSSSSHFLFVLFDRFVFEFIHFSIDCRFLFFYERYDIVMPHSASLFWTGRHQWFAAIFATQFYSNYSFNFAQDNVVRDATACFVVGDDLWFFANFLFETKRQEKQKTNRNDNRLIRVEKSRWQMRKQTNRNNIQTRNNSFR